MIPARLTTTHPGIPSPIATMERLIAENPKNAEVIFPYIGGEEVNSSPTHAHHRYVINFGERSEEECRREWPELMAIVEQKVKPERLAQESRDVAHATGGGIGETCPAMYAAIAGCEKILMHSFTSTILPVRLLVVWICVRRAPHCLRSS